MLYVARLSLNRHSSVSLHLSSSLSLSSLGLSTSFSPSLYRSLTLCHSLFPFVIHSFNRFSLYVKMSKSLWQYSTVQIPVYTCVLHRAYYSKVCRRQDLVAAFYVSSSCYFRTISLSSRDYSMFGCMLAILQDAGRRQKAGG